MRHVKRAAACVLLSEVLYHIVMGRGVVDELLTLQKSSYMIVQHYLLLSRNLLYTGLARAKQLAILMGPTKAIGLAVKRVADRQRYTVLADRLRLSNVSPLF